MAAREYSGSNMTLTRGDQARPQTRRSSQQRSANTRLLNPGVRPHVPHPRAHGRLGSKQVVSYRGRRIAQPAVVKKQLSLTFTVTVVLLIIGVVAAMGLSALSTTQTFTIQRLQSQERELTNRVESLTRDLEDRRSSAEIAQRAGDAGLLVPSAPGIVAVHEDGSVHEQRPFDPNETVGVVDVNESHARSGRASSDQHATREIGDSLTQLPGNNVLGSASRLDNVAPYAPNVPPTL